MIYSREKPWWHCEWWWLIPTVAACLVCYLRFPALENDDHSPIIRQIAETGDWPHVLAYRSAQHTPYYHTVSAFLYRALQAAAPIFPVSPDRAGQLVSLACFLSLSIILVFILRRLIPDIRARICALLLFGSSTRWVTMSVTIDNDTMMALLATLGLLFTIRMMAAKEMPLWGTIFLISFILGLGAAIKQNGQQFAIPLAVCLLMRGWLYGNRFSGLLARVLISSSIILLGTLPFYLRHHQDTGKWIHHDQGFHQKNWSGDRWEFFTFRFGEILRRPFIPIFDPDDERICPADLSWPSKIYIYWWSLPDFLPDRPPALPTAAIYVTALPLSGIFLLGLVISLRRASRSPPWWPPLGWTGIVAFFVILASLLFPEPRWGCHAYPRMWLGAAGGLIPLFGLGCGWLLARRTSVRRIIYPLVGIHVTVFWWLLLSGPFYTFYQP
ncbi:MAG: hypothetical protein P9M08_08895 [Candidatus Erginobacter occultus]|nr:hypothetical protein [Candidatus Erginobacter occultus]